MKKTIILLALYLAGLNANAQQALTNTGNLQVHAGATLSGLGAFNNTSTAAFVNNGSLYIKSNITNDQASMTPGSGTLYLDGSSAQAINGTQPFKTWHLVTNNGNGITLNNNLSVSGTHNFTAGIITTASTPNYLVYEAGSDYSGSNDSRHVNGWVKKMGATDFIFPVGNGTVQRTITINSISASSEFNVRFFINTPNSNQMQLPLTDVNEAEYWAVNRTSGGTATLTLNWDNSKISFPTWGISDIAVASYNGSTWTDAGGTASGSVTTTGTITSNTLSSFDLFTLGSKSYLLPATLIRFTATHKGDHTQIDWTSANEYNMAQYILERSDNGSSFYSLTQSLPRNRGNAQYNFKDFAPIQDVAYYRLRYKDLTGRENLSKVAVVTVLGNRDLTLLTNPVNNKITLVATPALNGMFNYTLTAANGITIQHGKLLMQNGGSYQLHLQQNLPPGPYTLNVQNERKSFRFKVIVL